MIDLTDLSLGSLSDYLYELEPIENMLHDPNRLVRAEAIRQLRPTRNRMFVNEIRALQFDSAPMVRQEASKKLKPIESYYRRWFFFFQSQTKKQPNYPGYRFGFAIVCLRYSQVWVHDAKLRDHFLHEALKHLNRVIRTFEPKSVYFYYRGQVLSSLRREKLAIEDFKKVLLARQRHWGAAFALVDLYLRTRQPHLAFEILDSMPTHHFLPI